MWAGCVLRCACSDALADQPSRPHRLCMCHDAIKEETIHVMQLCNEHTQLWVLYLPHSKCCCRGRQIRKLESYIQQQVNSCQVNSCGTFPTNFGVLLQGVLEKGITSLAVCLKHSFLFPEHEQQVGQLATTMGFTQISLSSEVMPMVKMVPRGYTAAADAYLTPHIMR